MTLQEVRNFLDACHEVQHFIDSFPDLPKGLSPRHIKALQAIHELQTKQNLPASANPPAKSRVKISDVSDFLGGTRPSVTKLIRELESCGALIKTPDTNDKRIIWLQLTALGEQYYEFFCLQYHTWLSQVLDEIPKEDLETTIRTICHARKILQNNHPPKP